MVTKHSDLTLASSDAALQHPHKGAKRLQAAALAVALTLSTGVALDSMSSAFAAESSDATTSSSLIASNMETVDPFSSSGQVSSGLSDAILHETATNGFEDAVAVITQAAAEKTRDAALDSVLSTATSLAGCPYAYGGSSPSGFDCSGFVRYVFQTTFGAELPHSAAAQSALGESVALSEVQRGDLLFWGSGWGVYHVGIALGDGTYIHAAGSGQGVVVDTMEYFTPTFAKRLF